MASRSRPTLKDVAEAAGVSFKTVSRVVNGEPGVATETAARVQQAVVTLGYAPDHRAQTLRHGGTRPQTIGLIHADLGNPFSASIHLGVEQIANEHHCLILAGGSAESPERQEALVRAFTGRRVDGLIVVPAGDTSGSANESAALEGEISRGTRVVFVDRDPGFAADVVVSDHHGGAVAATRHLIERGHRRIAFLSDRPELYSAAERARGFRDTMGAANLDTSMVAMGIISSSAARATVTSLLAAIAPPTAIFAGQNHLSIGAVHALHDADRQRDVALVGFDDFPMADVVEPAITVVPQDPVELGRTAARLLFARLETPEAPPARSVLPVRLVMRGSGEIEADGRHA